MNSNSPPKSAPKRFPMHAAQTFAPEDRPRPIACPSVFETPHRDVRTYLGFGVAAAVFTSFANPLMGLGILGATTGLLFANSCAAEQKSRRVLNRAAMQATRAVSVPPCPVKAKLHAENFDLGPDVGVSVAHAGSNKLSPSWLHQRYAQATVVGLVESPELAAANWAVQELPGQLDASLMAISEPHELDQNRAAVKAAMRLDWLSELPMRMPEATLQAPVMASVAAVKDDSLYVAHAGTGRALLAFKGATLRLTVDHTLNEPTESKRLKKVTPAMRALGTTRALGLQPTTSTAAQVTRLPLSFCRGATLVMVSSSIAKALTDQQVQKCFDTTDRPAQAAHKILTEASKRKPGAAGQVLLLRL